METKRNVTEIAVRSIPSWLQPKLRVCAYVRVSTSHDKQLDSLENQTQYYERKIRDNPEYEYCGIFSDAGISGAKENRPGFQAMITEARNANIDLIYTKSISRFARNTILLLETVRELKSIGVGVIFEEQNINTLHSEGELMLTVLASIAEEERKSVCSNVRWAMKNKCKRGEVMVDANRLLGYDKDENGKFVINKEQAKIVRRIYKLFLTGESAYGIADIFNAEAVPFYTKKPWASHRILSIISNEKYKGDCLMQKSFASDNGGQKLNKGQMAQFYVKNDHAALVTRKEWEAAQVIRKQNKKKIYPYTKLLKCPYCGANLIRVRHQKCWVSWICATYMQKGKAACIGMRITESVLQELTKDKPITEPMILEEVTHAGNKKKRYEKDYRLIPAFEYNAD